MSIEAIKQELTPEQYEAYNQPNSDYLCDTLGDIIEDLCVKLAASRASQWVKCSERLPSEDGQYWFYDPESGPYRAYYYTSLLPNEDITHWHPDTRPAPPKED